MLTTSVASWQNEPQPFGDGAIDSKGGDRTDVNGRFDAFQNPSNRNRKRSQTAKGKNH
ncbi:hypothetical protein JJD41_17545 [Oxynema sp. CENA135]|uniref:hypothetical protein n=1 Tax=Oxynema sp. CENA135 TaxID=984206 RepID=UPI00190C1A2C|nr:hypothetical protein [Oxynema sp. CENA135]MBK4731657.1 hypothetical protein [Oxynema sp. CENA135]